jgi:membrane-associated phospholipid phosphatase
LFARPLGRYYDELVMNLGIVILVSIIIVFLKKTENRTVLFFRLLYPAALFTFFYEQTGGLMNLFFPEFLDYQLASIENSILGNNPTLWLDKNGLINTGLTEILSFFYAAYYPMIPLFLLPLFFLKRHDIIKSSLAAICLTFFISYLLFYLYPIEGPRYYFADRYVNEISGPVFRPIVEFIQMNAAVHGGCMPSSHVGVAVVILIFCLKYFRKVGILLIPVNLGLAVGTVYGRYHYISDVIIGAAIGMVTTYFVMRRSEVKSKNDSLAANQQKEAIGYVS